MSSGSLTTVGRRRLILPIDGMLGVEDVLREAGMVLSDQGASEFIGMVKLNDGLHIPEHGPAILEELQAAFPDGTGFFIDLKIVDVSATVANVLGRYAPYNPSIVTVFSGVTAATLMKVREVLPHTKIALVDTLTDMSREECRSRHGMEPEEKIARAIEGFDVMLGSYNPIHLVVCGVSELEFLRNRFGDRFGFVCPGIRDIWMAGDHQKRVSGVYDALNFGATFMVMGAQLSRGNPARGISPDESRRRTFAEIERYFAEGGLQ